MSSPQEIVLTLPDGSTRAVPAAVAFAPIEAIGGDRHLEGPGTRGASPCHGCGRLGIGHRA